ncbi:MAG: FAD-dependent monooxygenase, partial [Lewinella sp.]|nr:FAD-dependent monooxygenase [Lewinella sp.]
MQDLKILIVGAGVAGLTCANLLKQQGLTPEIIEKERRRDFNESGYMLGLLPLGGRVLTELDLAGPYFDRSMEMSSYEIHREDGRLNKAYSLDFINEDYGSYRGITRQALVELLSEKLGAAHICFGMTVQEMEQTKEGVQITFSDGRRKMYELVIVADGMHSATRSLLWSEEEYRYRDTGWGGWVGWLDEAPDNVYQEYWGAASFMGLYPVEDKIGVFLGGPNEEVRELGLAQFAASIRKDIKPTFERLHRALDRLAGLDDPYYWEFHDCRTECWQKGRVILLGDAACGFLPTAGVGASMAMDSAAALVDELSRTDREHLEYGLTLFVKRQQERV